MNIIVFLNLSINYLFFLLGVLLPFSVFSTDVIILLIVFFWLLKHNKNFFLQLVQNKWFISILFFNIIYILGLFWGDNHQDSWYVIKSNLLFFCIPIFYTSEIKKKYIFYSFIGLCFSMFLSSIYGIFEYYEIIPHYFFRIYQNADLVALLNYRDHNIFLSFCIIICGLYYYKEYKLKSKSNFRYILLFMILTFIFSLFIERGRMGQFNFILMFLFFSVFFRRAKHVLFTLVGLILLLLINYNINYTFQQRINSTINNIKLIKSDINTSDNQRWYFVRTSLELIKRKPVLGHGTGSFINTFSKHSLTSRGFIERGHKTPHNYYLYVLFELGVLGFLFLFLFFYYQLYFHIKYKNKLAIYFCVIPFLLMCIGDSYLISHNSLILYIYLSFILTKLNINSFYSFR